MEKKITYTNETPLPREIVDYCIGHGYGERLIPLNAETANEIASILREQGIDV